MSNVIESQSQETMSDLIRANNEEFASRVQVNKLRTRCTVSGTEEGSAVIRKGEIIAIVSESDMIRLLRVSSCSEGKVYGETVDIYDKAGSEGWPIENIVTTTKQLDSLS